MILVLGKFEKQCNNRTYFYSNNLAKIKSLHMQEREKEPGYAGEREREREKERKDLPLTLKGHFLSSNSR